MYSIIVPNQKDYLLTTDVVCVRERDIIFNQILKIQISSLHNRMQLIIYIY